MPRVSATRRASSASARVQQPLPCTWRCPGVSASFRWTPVTSHPASTANAAATDESTPPLIATSTWSLTAPPPAGSSRPAARRSRCRVLRGQDLEGPGDGGRGGVHVGLGRAVAQAEPDRLPGRHRVPPHGHQHMRGRYRSTGTRRPRRARHPVPVQQQQQVLGPPPREPHRQQPGQPTPAGIEGGSGIRREGLGRVGGGGGAQGRREGTSRTRGGAAVEARGRVGGGVGGGASGGGGFDLRDRGAVELQVGGDGAEGGEEAGTEVGEGGGGAGGAVGEGGGRGGAEAGDGGGGEGPGAEAALLAAAVEERAQGR